jgi:hypothetical protein
LPRQSIATIKSIDMISCSWDMKEKATTIEHNGVITGASPGKIVPFFARNRGRSRRHRAYAVTICLRFKKLGGFDPLFSQPRCEIGIRSTGSREVIQQILGWPQPHVQFYARVVRER